MPPEETLGGILGLRILNDKPSTLNPKSSTLNPRVSGFKEGRDGVEGSELRNVEGTPPSCKP